VVVVRVAQEGGLREAHDRASGYNLLGGDFAPPVIERNDGAKRRKTPETALSKETRAAPPGILTQ
jgi:hypothetical protein